MGGGHFENMELGVAKFRTQMQKGFYKHQFVYSCLGGINQISTATTNIKTPWVMAQWYSPLPLQDLKKGSGFKSTAVQVKAPVSRFKTQSFINPKFESQCDIH